MHALILADGEYRTELYESLCGRLIDRLAQAGYETEVEVLDGSLRPCMGCFGCWVRTPGECVIRDGMADINRRYMQSDAVVFLSPVVFGQCSANIKNVLDRTLPHMLPFFECRADGSTGHPPRYKRYPLVWMIGYGTDLEDEEIRLFLDITQKHRPEVGVAVCTGESDFDGVERLFAAHGTKRTEA